MLCGCDNVDTHNEVVHVHTEANKFHNAFYRDQNEQEAMMHDSSVLERALKSPIEFKTFDTSTFNPKRSTRDGFALTAEGERNLDNLALAMKSSPNDDVEIRATVGPPKTYRSTWLSCEMADFIKEALQKKGVRNQIVATGLGCVQGKDSGLEVRGVSNEERVKAEKADAETRKKFEVRLADAMTNTIPFQRVDLKKFSVEKDEHRIADPGDANLDKLAAVLKEDPSLKVTTLGFADPPNHSNNMKLSQARANKIKEALERRGVKNTIIAKGMGQIDENGPRGEFSMGEEEKPKPAPVPAPVPAAAPAPVPVVEKPKDGACMILGVKQGGKESEVLLYQRPLGLTFWDQTLPIVITRVEDYGHAKTRGAQVDMEVVAVNKVPTAGKPFHEVTDMLRKGAAALPLMQHK